MKSNQRLRFLAVASLAIAGATFTYGQDRTGSGAGAGSGTSSGTSQSGSNASDHQDRSSGQKFQNGRALHGVPYGPKHLARRRDDHGDPSATNMRWPSPLTLP